MLRERSCPASTIAADSPHLYRPTLFQGHRVYFTFPRSRVTPSVSTILVNRHCFSGLIDPGSAARSLGPPAYGCFIFSPFLPLPLRLPSTRCHPHAPTSSFVFASRILLYMDRIPTEGPASASLRSHASFPSLRSPPCRRRRPGKQACCTYMHMNARSAQCIRLRAADARCLRVPSGASCHPARRCSSRVVRNPAAPRAASAS